MQKVLTNPNCLMRVDLVSRVLYNITPLHIIVANVWLVASPLLTLVCEQECLPVLCWHFGVSWRLNYNSMTFMGARMLSLKEEEPNFSLLPFFIRHLLPQCPACVASSLSGAIALIFPFLLSSERVTQSFLYFQVELFWLPQTKSCMCQQLIWAFLQLLLLLFNDVSFLVRGAHFLQKY